MIDALRRGDDNAWWRLDNRYRSLLGLLMRSAISPSERPRFDTEDLLQSTFLCAFHELDSFEYRGKGSFQSWLTSMLMNRMRTQKRRQRAQCRDFRAEKRAEGQTDDIEDLKEVPEKLYQEAERKAKLVQALASLPDEERYAVQWQYMDGEDQAEVAMRLGLSVGTVRKRVNTALRRLRHVLEA